MTKLLRLSLFSILLALPAAAFAADSAPPELIGPQALAKTGDMASVHLASYRSRDMAEKGWKVLDDHYSGLIYFKPVIREVDLPGKGHFYRLFAEGEPAMIASLCASLKARKLYCDPHPITPGTAKP